MSRTLVSKDRLWCVYAKNQGIPRRLIRNSMESYNHLVKGMKIDMHNLDNGMVKPILLNLKRIRN